MERCLDGFQSPENLTQSSTVVPRSPGSLIAQHGSLCNADAGFRSSSSQDTLKSPASSNILSVEDVAAWRCAVLDDTPPSASPRDRRANGTGSDAEGCLYEALACWPEIYMESHFLGEALKLPSQRQSPRLEPDNSLSWSRVEISVPPSPSRLEHSKSGASILSYPQAAISATGLRPKSRLPTRPSMAFTGGGQSCLHPNCGGSFDGLKACKLAGRGHASLDSYPIVLDSNRQTGFARSQDTNRHTWTNDSSKANASRTRVSSEHAYLFAARAANATTAVPTFDATILDHFVCLHAIVFELTKAMTRPGSKHTALHGNQPQALHPCAAARGSSAMRTLAACG